MAKKWCLSIRGAQLWNIWLMKVKTVEVLFHKHIKTNSASLSKFCYSFVTNFLFIQNILVHKLLEYVFYQHYIITSILVKNNKILIVVFYKVPWYQQSLLWLLDIERRFLKVLLELVYSDLSFVIPIQFYQIFNSTI